MDTSLHHLLSSLSPDAALLVATVGIGLIFVELNRPGRALPGALGLLLVLLATASLLPFGLRPWALVLLACCTAVFLCTVWQRVPWWLLAVATAGTIGGLRFLLSPGTLVTVHTSVAVVCGGLLGAASAVLARFARRARRSKALD